MLLVVKFLVSLSIVLNVLPCIYATNVLFFGDSVMRGIVTEWCEHLHSKNSSIEIMDWGPIELKYGMSNLKLHSPGYCSNGQGDSIAQIHLFGSNAKEPYYVDEWEKASSPAENRNTDYRIEKGLHAYMESFGLPDRIMFTTCNWDAAANGHKIETYENFTLDTFRTNTLRIRSLIQRLLGENKDKVDVGIQSCVLDWTIHDYIEDFNYMYRNLSLSEHITMYDYDFDVWASTDFKMDIDGQMFIFHKKHDIHPAYPYPVVAAEKLFGNQYSKYLYEKGMRHTHPLVQLPSKMKKVYFMQVVGSDEIFFIDRKTDGSLVRYSGAGKTMLKRLHLSTADVLTVTPELMSSIQVSGSVAQMNDPNHERFGYITQDGRCLLRYREKFYQMADFLMLRYFFTENEIVRDVLNLVADIIPTDKVIFSSAPTFMRNGVLVRNANARQVYYIDNYRKHKVMSAQAFFRRGWDFDNVVVIYDEIADFYYPLLPDGPDIA